MIIIDLFDIDFHIFTVIKFLFNLGVRIKYIYILGVRFKYIYIKFLFNLGSKELSILYVNDNRRSIRNRLSHFHSYKIFI